jgi:copper(I)-binding protein
MSPSIPTSGPTWPDSARPWAARRVAEAVLAGAAMAIGMASAVPVQAHDFHLGALRLDHPYATPTPAGATTGAAYLRGIRNTGDQPDRLVGARTPVAGAVEIHRHEVDERQVMRMREVAGIDVPARGEVRLRHDGPFHLMLIDLKAPLKVGDRFPLTLRFEKAGERKVTVWVQQPRAAAAPHDHRH